MNFPITIRQLALTTLCFGLAGCLSRPALVKRTYALQSPPANIKTDRGDAVLALELCQVSPMFAGRSLVYRTGPDAYETDPYATFLVTPDRTVEIPIRAYLRNCGAFKDVVEPGSSIKIDQVMEIHVTEFYADLRKDVPAAAVLSLRLALMDASGASTGRPLFQKDYSQRCPINSNTADAIVNGWNQALGLIMKQAAVDLGNVERAAVIQSSSKFETEGGTP